MSITGYRLRQHNLKVGIALLASLRLLRLRRGDLLHLRRLPLPPRERQPGTIEGRPRQTRRGCPASRRHRGARYCSPLSHHACIALRSRRLSTLPRNLVYPSPLVVGREPMWREVDAGIYTSCPTRVSTLSRSSTFQIGFPTVSLVLPR